MRRPRLTWAQAAPPFYWWATFTLRGLLWGIVRWRVRGRGNVPIEGAVIVVANHLNNTDPPILGAAVARRRIRFMAKVELFKYPMGVLPRLYDAFPVRRFEADMAAMLNAERLLKRGEVLGMFPEGTRSRTRIFGELHPGTALIALRSGAQVLPCAITGTEIFAKPWMLALRPRIAVRIGEPIAVERVRRPTEEQVSALTQHIHDAIAALLPPAYGGSYTGSHGRDSTRE
ncbi:MAG: lysophospholipid acyltransferase family protein [Tepidiformaceae bacterium]